MASAQKINREIYHMGAGVKEPGLRRKTSKKEDTGPAMGIGNGVMSSYLTNADISDPTDYEEVEADRIADKVLSLGMIHRRKEVSVTDGLKSGVEASLGNGVNNVNIHTDDEAAELSASINARAFTDGGDIYFGKGEYRPDTYDGQRLIAHELAHVAQAEHEVGRKK